ncbi:hypothetical protein SS50377_22332 [Spironucleus salmonicida]|uniref:Uncharacterized protein n=1 Tax=Spironucleus salmonicida TaxID=348837 RepID=V6LN82_9EUKA|nr:hypothetical protein SS50377_22332 [Spironucleus salmonicida]|eukprot:EST42174.1 Hypothetical protein SS50377_18480 [Spironucleus salmonicida]
MYHLYIDLGQFCTKIAFLPCNQYQFTIQTSQVNIFDLIYNTLRINPECTILILPQNPFSDQTLQNTLTQLNFQQILRPLQSSLYFQGQNGILIQFGEEHVSVNFYKNQQPIFNKFTIFNYGEKNRIKRLLVEVKKQANLIQLNALRKAIQNGVKEGVKLIMGKQIYITNEMVQCSNQFYSQIIDYCINNWEFQDKQQLVISGFFAQEFLDSHVDIFSKFDVVVTNGLAQASELIK